MRESGLPSATFFAPAAADCDLVANRAVFNRLKRTLADAPAAVIALLGVDLKLAVNQLSHADRTALFNLTDLCIRGICPNRFPECAGLTMPKSFRFGFT